MTPIRIDLFSDTMTKPSAGMRRAIAEAEVGDEQKREDPTTNRLQEMVAELLGKERALFLPSGTMCNQIAIRLHCRPGDEIITDRSNHIVNFEVAGAAAFAGAAVCTLQGDRGRFTAEQVEEVIRPVALNHAPRTRLVSVEQTANMGGGAVWPLAQLREVSATAKKHGLATHMDGARLMNAVVASGIAAREMTEGFDSAWVDFSKGLGAPVGAALAGTEEFIREAWRMKHQFGGALRQSGMVTAACIYALEHNVERLSEDHANAKRLAEGLAELPGITVEPAETNIVFFDVRGTGLTGAQFAERLLLRGVRVSPALAKTRLRAVTHLDVNRQDIEEALLVIREVVRGN